MFKSISSWFDDLPGLSDTGLELQYPELLLLAIPLWFLYRKFGKSRGATGAFRIVILLLLLICLCGPRYNVGGNGIDVIVVADRSLSMPEDAPESLKELLNNLDRNRGKSNKVGLVTFGSEANVERIPSNATNFEGYTKEVLPDGSDLHSAIEKALSVVNPNRPARLFVFSDGEYNGPSPISAARRAREAEVPIDYRNYERVHVGDVAVESVLMPKTVSPREPFQFSVWIYADKAATGTVTISRDDREIAQREQTFSLGMNRLLFRDLIDEGGFFQYDVKLEVENDPLLENNNGTGIVRVDAGPRVLVLSNDGQEGNLVNALRAGRIPVDVAVAKEHPLTQDSLDPYRAVIIENIPAREFGRLKMSRLTQFVEDLGGGLLLTGGQRSFGVGGYFNSPLDEILPVSMEIREEHRKNRLALAIALDRSGSMMAPVSGGKTKMDLANLGTAECVRLLSPGDSVAVIAVDSAPHVIQPLTDVEDPEPIASRVLKIQSEGGGIFVYEALVAAGNELMKAEQATKHIILFSDAQDSEHPASYKGLLQKYEEAGITVSVIGLGTKADVDAKLLEDIAKRGSGNIMFTADAAELPRLFTEDTMSVARSSFIEKDVETQPDGIPGSLLTDLRLMGEFQQGAFPTVDGYNLSYLKPDATMGVASNDEYNAPWSAFWYRGLGRSAALCIEVDGQYSGQFGQWDQFEDFLITHTRWLMGGDDPNKVFVAMERDGQDAVVTIELDEQRIQKTDEPPELVVVQPGQERTETYTPDLTWIGPNTLQTRFRLNKTGTYRTMVRTGAKEFERGPAITLPYSPEYVPRIGLPSGTETLKQLSEISGGVARTDVLQVFKDPPRSAFRISLIPYLLGLTLCCFVLEIAGRRLSLWQRGPVKEKAEEDEGLYERAVGWLPKIRWPKREKKLEPSFPQPEPPPEQKKKRREQKAEPVKPKVDVFAQAKNRANRRLK